MSDTVIQVENLSKQYRLGEVSTGTLAHDLNRWWHRIRGKEDPYLKVTQANVRDRKAEVGGTRSEVGGRGARVSAQARAAGGDESSPPPSDLRLPCEALTKQGPPTASLSPPPSTLHPGPSPLPPSDYVWALKDVSFEVKRGEVLGIIGANGAGKSTLLKILSRVTAPTRGRVVIEGRVGSLLEVGVGFHPELTGLENIFLNGTIMGMRKAEVAAKLDEIVEFSGCARYLDTPVKRYSSGMRVRLGFAVAAHLEPEILIVDEVLAVGDAEFQRKCLGKMKDVAGHGRTVLFVSHNMRAVANLCSRSILLKGGEIACSGSPEFVMTRYLQSPTDSCRQSDIRKAIAQIPTDRTFRLEDITLSQSGQAVERQIATGSPLEIQVTYRVLEPTRGLRVILDLCDPDHTLLFRSFHDEAADGISSLQPGRYRSTAVIPPDVLGPTQYELRVLAGIHGVRMCLPSAGIRIPVAAVATGNYNKAYPRDTFRGKLGFVLHWSTRSES